MVTEEQKRYAKVAQLSLRVYLNTQAMLSHLSRQISSDGKAGRRMDPELFRRSLEDLESCLDEFENLTGINMIHAKTLHAQSLTAWKRKDLSSVYELVQKLYRDGYLSTLIELTK